MANVTRCSSDISHYLPTQIHNDTDKLVVTYNNITELCGTFPYFERIKILDVQHNNVSAICPGFVVKLQKYEQMNEFNLANNNLSSIPTHMQRLRIQRIFLSGNPYHCNCQMAWMIPWLNNFKTRSGEPVIVDYKELRCHRGMMVGQPIYKLDKVKMGCFPPELTLWQKIFGGVVGIVILWLIVLVVRRSRDIKFFLYYYCRWCTFFGIPKDDKNEKLKKMLYDAYISFR